MSHDSATRRPRLLIMAYACSPYRGSESAVGWRRAVQAARDFDVWVITEEREFAPDMERYFRENGRISGLNFVYVPMRPWEWSLGNVQTAIWYWSLHRWQRRAFAVAKELHKEIGFDLAHQLTFCGYREPSYLWRLDCPFVWGPVGGTHNFPWRFIAEAGYGGFVKESLRNLANSWQLRFNRRAHDAAKKATCLVSATTTSQRDLRTYFGVESRLLSDVGVESCIDSERPLRDPNAPLRLLWSGTFAPGKALPLLLKALAALPPEISFELRILGDGKMATSWKKLAVKLRVDSRIQWLGWIPHSEAKKQFHWADIFTFTSLRDTTGTVLVESLAAGTPVLCMDIQGAHDVIDESCGVRIPVESPKVAIRRIADVIGTLVNEPETLKRLSDGAVARAKKYLWSVQGERMREIYETAMRKASPNRRFDLENLRTDGFTTSGGAQTDTSLIESEIALGGRRQDVIL